MTKKELFESLFFWIFAAFIVWFIYFYEPESESEAVQQGLPAETTSFLQMTEEEQNAFLEKVEEDRKKEWESRIVNEYTISDGPDVTSTLVCINHRKWILIETPVSRDLVPWSETVHTGTQECSYRERTKLPLTEWVSWMQK